MEQGRTWPETLWIVRHGESAGNVARAAALAAHLPVIDIPMRDVDVPLSPRGEQQARALGHWFGTQPPHERPSVVLTSPYRRACHTADLIRAVAGLDGPELVYAADERLREKEFGVLDRLTRDGIAARYPEQAEFRRLLGKFYHRPPGGESWCDVILRLRSLIDTVRRDYAGERVLLVCHSVVVLCLRYLLEQLTEAQILEIDHAGDVANCAITAYQFDAAQGRGGGLALRLYNVVAPLDAAGAAVTREPDVKRKAP